MKNKLLYLICSILLYSCYPKETRQTASFSLPLQERVFYKVTDRNLGYYFKNPADSSLLGKIVPAIAFDYSIIPPDSLETFFSAIGLCGYNLATKKYTPCDFRYFRLFKVNDKYKGIDTVFVSNDWVRYKENPPITNSYTLISSGKHTHGNHISYNTKYIDREVVGYYIDKLGYKEIIIHYRDMWCAPEGENTTGLKLCKWTNAVYLVDSILTLNDTLIPKNTYRKYYEKYAIECDQ